MNASTGRRRGVGRLALALVSLMVSGSLFAAKTTVILVEGEDDDAVDWDNIQSAINGAPEKSIIHLKGVFQLDGQSVEIRNPHLKIIGVESDGREMPLIKGKTDDDGFPLEDTETTLRNRGFTVLAENVSIKNVELADLNRAVSVTTIGGTSRYCDEIAVVESVSDVSIKNLVISNSLRGIQVYGGVQDVEIKNNIITDMYLDGVILRSGSIACCLDNSTSCNDQFNNPAVDPGTLDIGDATGVKVTNNLASTENDAVNVWPSPFSASGPSTDVLVKGNTFDGGMAAVSLFDDVEDFVLTENLIVNGGSQGFESYRLGGIALGFDFVGLGASGYTVRGNEYLNNLASEPLPSTNYVPRDVWLQSGTSDNTVTEVEGTIILDEGSANTVTLKPAD